jgi:hypothetical protein
MSSKMLRDRRNIWYIDFVVCECELLNLQFFTHYSLVCMSLAVILLKEKNNTTLIPRITEFGLNTVKIDLTVLQLR